ncbi:MAG: hypothetical protein ABSC19_02300 [Syntrophorhabdales bacterium]|jgi:hypothetical protein
MRIGKRSRYRVIARLRQAVTAEESGVEITHRQLLFAYECDILAESIIPT